MLSELDEDSSSKNWCPKPSRVQNRLKLLREISGAPSSRDVASAQRNRHRLMAAFRSSIRSRSTSQNLSDERRRLCVGSRWLVSSSFEAVLRDALEFGRFLQPPFGPRRPEACAPQSSRSHRQRFSLLVSPFLFTFGSCHDVTPVVTDLLRRLALHLSR